MRHRGGPRWMLHCDDDVEGEIPSCIQASRLLHGYGFAGEDFRDLIDAGELRARKRRRDTVERAIADLGLKPDADVEFAAAWIETQLYSWGPPDNNNPPALAPSVVASELWELARAFRDVRRVLTGFSEQASDALHDEASWRHRLSDNLVDLLDDRYPDLIEVAEAAAKRLQSVKRRGRRRDPRPTELATGLANIYERLTGKDAPESRSENRFSVFVGKIFALAGLPMSADHYAALGAKLAHEKWERKGAK